MSKIDFGIPADVFWSKSGRRSSFQKGLQFRRFASLAEAVRFVVEDRSETRFACAIDTDDDRFTDDEIGALYRRDDFPVPAETDKCMASGRAF